LVAGTYILYASHIAVMAPATNLGAATPVAIGGQPESASSAGKAEKGVAAGNEGESRSMSTMMRKQTNDAAAYIRGFAQLRGRNADWAERAVREAVSLSAQEALKLKVIDVIASDLPQLLKRVDGRKIATSAGERQLATADAATVGFEPDWRARLLMVITDPSVAYILLLIGFYGMLFEFYNPGLVAPGVIGGICMLLALFAFQLLPVSYAGLGLIAFGVGLMVAEHFVAGFGVLGLGGIAAFVIGSIMLMDTDVPGHRISWQLVAGAAAASALFLLVVLNLAMRARRMPVVCGGEDMIGAGGEVIGESGGVVFARVHGETWQVRAAVPLARGQKLKVVRMDGLVLTVEPALQGDGK